jgi:hypothetical protein
VSSSNLWFRTTERLQDATAEDPDVGYLNDWHDTYHSAPAFLIWADYQKANPAKKYMPSFALSLAQACRAADFKPKFHMQFSSNNEALVRDKSYWGAIEVGKHFADGCTKGLSLLLQKF